MLDNPQNTLRNSDHGLERPGYEGDSTGMLRILSDFDIELFDDFICDFSECWGDVCSCVSDVLFYEL